MHVRQAAAFDVLCATSLPCNCLSSEACMHVQRSKRHASGRGAGVRLCGFQIKSPSPNESRPRLGCPPNAHS